MKNIFFIRQMSFLYEKKVYLFQKLLIYFLDQLNFQFAFEELLEDSFIETLLDIIGFLNIFNLNFL